MTLRELWNVTCRNRIQVQVEKHNGWMFVVDGRSTTDPHQLVPLCLGSEEYADRKVLDIGTTEIPNYGTIIRVVVEDTAKPKKTISFVVYACETNFLTDEERESGNYEPLADIEVPEDVARAFYEETDARQEVAEELGIPVQDATFEMWHDQVYTADSTVGLCEFARNHGCTNI